MTTIYLVNETFGHDTVESLRAFSTEASAVKYMQAKEEECERLEKLKSEYESLKSDWFHATPPPSPPDGGLLLIPIRYASFGVSKEAAQAFNEALAAWRQLESAAYKQYKDSLHITDEIYEAMDRVQYTDYRMEEVEYE